MAYWLAVWTLLWREMVRFFGQYRRGSGYAARLLAADRIRIGDTATHLLEDGYDIRTIQELLGHSAVSTTMSTRTFAIAAAAGSAARLTWDREGTVQKGTES